jgi:hypothetical protein
MKSLSFSLMLILGVSSLAMLPASGIETVDLLIGNWSCESGPCFDEEISFAIEDGEQTFNSWLHERPSATGGSWQLKGNELVIECCAGAGFEWTIIKLTETELVVREEGGVDEIVFVRIED